MSAEAERKTETIPEWKREEVGKLTDFVDDYSSVGVVNITGIPSKQLQNMRRSLHGSAELRVSRNTLVRRALSEVGEGFEDLEEYVDGQIGLIGTNDNPFGLYRELEASKSPAPISAGEVAPNQIVIPEGDTGVDPGPFVGELQQAGAAARIMDGSIHVTEDSVVAEEGDEVSEALANVLSELGMEPKEVGLDLRAVYSDGVMFESDELAIDVDEYRADIETAAAFGRNLSVNAVFPTEQTVPLLVSKATGEAKSLGLQAAIESPDLAPDLVSKADAQVRTLAAQIDDEDALPEELRGIEAPAAGGVAEEEESTDEETEAEPDDEDDEDDDDDAAGEGLGAMFG
ncbi:50S ribosomal protein L10 [Haladaptatus sp. NG-SE-30]